MKKTKKDRKMIIKYQNQTGVNKHIAWAMICKDKEDGK